MSKRLAGRCGYPADEPFRVTVHPSRLDDPLGWKKPRMIFVCSMGDLFHPDVPLEFLDDVFETIANAPQHTFQVLTKRAIWMEDYMLTVGARLRYRGVNAPDVLPNVWLGVSAENQAAADARIPYLLKTLARVRFVSIEPMLGEIDLSRWLMPQSVVDGYYEVMERFGGDVPPPGPVGPPQRLDWVIIGSESGPRRRECRLEWVSSLIYQCTVTETPVFVKQLEIAGTVVKMPRIFGRKWDEMP